MTANMKVAACILPLILACTAEVISHDQHVPLQVSLDRESKAASCSFQSYTSLGDSFAVGFGSNQRLGLCQSGQNQYGTQCTTKECGKDIGSYAYMFAARHNLNANFHYSACSGAASDEILSQQVNNAAAFGTPDLITINAGGDDSNAFSTVARACMFDFGSYNSTVCGQEIAAAKNTINNELPQKLKVLFGAVRQKAPSARVVVMSYIKFWANLDTTQCAWPLNEASPVYKQQMNTLVDNINALLQKAATAFGFLYADADAAYEGHRVCSQLGKNSFISWFQMFPKVGDDTAGAFYLEPSLAHPTLDGQKAYLAALEKALGC